MNAKIVDRIADIASIAIGILMFAIFSHYPFILRAIICFISSFLTAWGVEVVLTKWYNKRNYWNMAPKNQE